MGRRINIVETSLTSEVLVISDRAFFPGNGSRIARVAADVTGLPVRVVWSGDIADRTDVIVYSPAVPTAPAERWNWWV